MALAALSPTLLGALCAFIHVIGPDHLGTLMTLSMLLPPGRAFLVGAWWGAGHCVGMVLITAIVTPFVKLSKIDLEKWEYVGNYFIGASMMLVGTYFVLRERRFVKRRDDGSIQVNTCDCCQHEGALTWTLPTAGSSGAGSAGWRKARCEDSDSSVGSRKSSRSFQRGRGHAHCSGYSQSSRCNQGHCEESPCSHGQASEASPLASAAGAAGAQASYASCEALLPPDPEAVAGRRAQPSCSHEAEVDEGGLHQERTLQGALLGMVQGACCPMGLVSIGFLVKLSPAQAFLFLAVFVILSTLGCGVAAVGMASLMSMGMGARISPLLIYRCGCTITLLLGLAWLLANKLGVIDRLDVADGLHSRAMAAGGS